MSEPKAKPVARTCEYCGHAKGTVAFRYYKRGEALRGYFHPGCFSSFLAALGA